LEKLQKAAAGSWGMFGAYLNTPGLGPRANDDFRELNGLGDEIGKIRKNLGIIEEYRPYRRYREYCKRHGPNDPGEPRLAKEFLAELDDYEGEATAALPPDKLPG
jgi:hypothetical protein